MVTGWILDVHPDHEHDVMVTWLRTENKIQRIEESFHPCFYVHASSQDLRHIASILKGLPQVEQVCFTSKRITLGSQKTTRLLQITPASLRHFHTVTSMVDSWGRFHRYQLFNVDIRLPTHYLLHHQAVSYTHLTLPTN